MTNKEVKEIIRDMKRNRLYKRVINEIVEDSKEYGGKNMQERLQARLSDVGHGLSSGIVGSLISYHQTTTFFNRYRNEIAELLTNWGEETGQTLQDLNGFDNSDPFIRGIYNKNLLSWASYEIIAGRLENQLYD
jgi:hypothetical protein